MIPRVLPVNLGHGDPGPPPRLQFLLVLGILREAASISARACSATAMAEYPGVLVTLMPNREAASRSILSVPMPRTAIIFKSGQEQGGTREFGISSDVTATRAPGVAPQLFGEAAFSV